MDWLYSKRRKCQGPRKRTLACTIHSAASLVADSQVPEVDMESAPRNFTKASLEPNLFIVDILHELHVTCLSPGNSTIVHSFAEQSVTSLAMLVGVPADHGEW